MFEHYLEKALQTLTFRAAVGGLRTAVMDMFSRFHGVTP